MFIMMEYNIYTIFSRWHESSFGWKSQISPAPKKDITIVIRFEMLGCSYGFGEDTRQSIGIEEYKIIFN